MDLYKPMFSRIDLQQRALTPLVLIGNKHVKISGTTLSIMHEIIGIMI